MKWLRFVDQESRVVDVLTLFVCWRFLVIFFARFFIFYFNRVEKCKFYNSVGVTAVSFLKLSVWRLCSSFPNFKRFWKIGFFEVFLHIFQIWQKFERYYPSEKVLQSSWKMIERKNWNCFPVPPVENISNIIAFLKRMQKTFKIKFCTYLNRFSKLIYSQLILIIHAYLIGSFMNLTAEEHRNC